MAEETKPSTQSVATPEGQQEGKPATATAGAQTTTSVEELIKSNPELMAYIDKQRTQAAKSREKNLRDEHDLIPKTKEQQTQTAPAVPNEVLETLKALTEKVTSLESSLSAKQSNEKLAELCKETGVSIEDAKGILSLTGSETNAKERLEKFAQKTSPKSFVPGGSNGGKNTVFSEIEKQLLGQ